MSSILVSSWWISAQLIINEAKKKWLKYKILSRQDNLFYIINKWKKIFFKSVDFWQNTSFWIKAANNKEINYILANQFNIRIPQSIYINREELNTIDLEKLNLKFPVISKPIDWWHWDWVSINITNYNELKSWVEFSFFDSSTNRVVIQEQIKWDDHRILVIDWRVEAITKRVPPFIIWTWNKTIQELLDIENSNPLRWKWWDHDAPMSKIRIDTELKETIKQQWYTLESILKKWKKLTVRNNANLSSWWIAIDVTTLAHSEIKKEAEKMAKVLQLNLCAVDFLCTDISLPLIEWWWAIIESWATPWIRMHHYPSKWTPINVAKIILESALNKK